MDFDPPVLFDLRPRLFKFILHGAPFIQSILAQFVETSTGLRLERVKSKPPLND